MQSAAAPTSAAANKMTSVFCFILPVVATSRSWPAAIIFGTKRWYANAEIAATIAKVASSSNDVQYGIAVYAAATAEKFIAAASNCPLFPYIMSLDDGY